MTSDPDEKMIEHCRTLARCIAENHPLSDDDRSWLMFMLGAVHGAVIERKTMAQRMVVKTLESTPPKKRVRKRAGK